MDIKKQFRKAISEHQNQINFQPYEDEDDDAFGIKAFSGEKLVGDISGKEMFDAYHYDLDDVMSEDEFENLFTDDVLIKLDYVSVKEKYRGIGSELVKRFLNNCDKKGNKQYYLNASPMGFDGLDLPNLILFYRKFGFEVFKHQGGNAIMIRIKQ